MSTLTQQQRDAISAKLAGMHITVGLGTEHEACSVAAINLALTGALTDKIPDCMSAVIGRWIITVQDAMPDAMRNSAQWRELIPLAAGTGRGAEIERSGLIIDWMWSVVLPALQPTADSGGFGAEWAGMCVLKTSTSASTAWAAASAASTSSAASIAWAAGWAAASAASTASAAAWATKAGLWEKFDPAGLLGRLIAVSENIK